jgi:hypothetical protein
MAEAPVSGDMSQAWAASGDCVGVAPVLGAASQSYDIGAASAIGVGIVSGSADESWTVDSTFYASAVVSGAASESWDAAGTLFAVAPISGDASQSWSGTGSPFGAAVVAGSASQAWDTTGDIFASAFVSGSAEETWTASGVPTVVGVVSGSAVQTWSDSGSITGSASISGDASESWSISAVFYGTAVVSASCTETWATTGATVAIGFASGSAEEQWQASGLLIQTVDDAPELSKNPSQAILRALVRDAIIDHFGLSECQCGINFNGQPHPNSGPVYISVHPGKWRRIRRWRKGPLLDEEFGFQVTITVKNSAVQPKFYGEWFMQKTAALNSCGAGLESLSRAIAVYLHDNGSIICELAKRASGLSHFSGGIFWENGSVPKQRRAKWWLCPYQTGNPSIGLSQTLVFGGLRRSQPTADRS